MFNTWLESKLNHNKDIFLDLDENLIHTNFYYMEPGDDVIVLVRPHLENFLNTLSKKANLSILTMSTEKYADTILSKLDLTKYLKNIFCAREDIDLKKKMDLKDYHWLLVDNNPMHNPHVQKKLSMLGDIGFFIQSKTWTGDKDDECLIDLIPKIEKDLAI